MIEGKATIQKESIAATLLANQQLNLWGIGSALIGLQVLPCAATAFSAGYAGGPLTFYLSVFGKHRWVRQG